MVKAVIFDLDNTLYDYTSNHKAGMSALTEKGAELLHVPASEFAMTFEAGKAAVKGRHAGRATSHSRLLFCQKTVELLGGNPFAVVPVLCKVYWAAFFENMVPYDGAMDFLKELKARKIRTAICTDMTAHIQYRKIEAMGFSQYLDCLVTSEEAMAEKPSAVLFQLALDKLDVASSEAVYVGDSRERDVQGALWNGIRPIYFVGERAYEPEEGIEVARTYAEVRKLVLGD